MITIRIGTTEREGADPGDFDQAWVRQELEHASTNGPVCVMVSINIGEIDLRLATSACPQGGGGRQPRPDEEKIFRLWQDCGLTGQRVEVHDLFRFLQRVRHLL